MRNVLSSLVLVFALAGLCSMAQAASRLVPGSYATIQAAVDAATDGDEVHVTAAGTYQDNANGVTIDNKNISVIGDVAGVVINGQVKTSGAAVVTLNNLKIYDCAFDGIDMASAGDLTVINCVVDYNPGRGLLHEGTGNVTVTGSTFSRQNFDGYCKGNPTAGNLTMSDCVFNNNSRAAIMIEGGGGTHTFTNTQIHDNNVGIYTAGSAEMPTFTLNNCTLTDNPQDQMLITRKATINLTGCTVQNTKAPSFMAGIRLDGSAVGQTGRSTITLTNTNFSCPFEKNGNWWAHQADVTINGCSFTGYGPAIVLQDSHNEVAITMNDTTFDGSIDTAQSVIAAYEQDPKGDAKSTKLTLNRCTLTGGAGDVISGAASEVTLTNCILKKGNSQVRSSGAQGWAKIKNCTMVGDAATTAVTITNTTTENLVANTIIDNAGKGLLAAAGSTVTNHHNLIRATAANLEGVTAGASTQLGANPLFVSATDLHLQATSPALNAGDATLGVVEDIAKAVRPAPAGSNPDLGAYEMGGQVPVSLSSFWSEFN